jgi:hypothetical protein
VSDLINEFAVCHSTATWEISRRGSLGGSGLVSDGLGTIYIGLDQDAQRKLNTSYLTFDPSPAPKTLAEKTPYSDWLAKRDEPTVSEDDPKIAVMLDGYAYLETDKEGYDEYVRVIPVALPLAEQ